ncbi:MAG TPA: alpha/beta hydrolase [Candidatus Baltobacteraceae bacterium]|nr:alpha/beta hydrolase [Candidatus Baltobacteraceae bacterium]
MNQARKPSIVILHGANGTAAIMKPLADALSVCVETFTPNMLGHGGREVPERATIEALATDIIAQMDAVGLRRAYLFGFSSGGLLALYLARHFPERFHGVCTLAAKYVFDQRTVSHWTYMISFDRLERPGSKRPQELAEDHAPQDWKKVIVMNRDMFIAFGKKAPLSELDLQAISIPALLFSSSEDQIVPLEETLALGRLIPNSKPVIFHGQCHPFHAVPLPPMATAICNWIEEIERRDTPKPPLVVIHGANGSGASMQPFSDQLKPYMDVFAPDLIGHAGRPLPERLTIEEMAADVIAQMDARDLARAYLFGYSSGGYLALYLARHYPERFIAVAALAVKYVFDERTVAHWTHLADAKRVRERNPQSGRMDELIRMHHPQDWETLVGLTCEYFKSLGRKEPLSIDDLRGISQPAMLFSSDNDQVVPLSEATELAKLLPDSRLVVFKGQSHPFKVVPVVAIARALTNWIDELQKANAASV